MLLRPSSKKTLKKLNCNNISYDVNTQLQRTAKSKGNPFELTSEGAVSISEIKAAVINNYPKYYLKGSFWFITFWVSTSFIVHFNVVLLWLYCWAMYGYCQKMCPVCYRNIQRFFCFVLFCFIFWICGFLDSKCSIDVAVVIFFC